MHTVLRERDDWDDLDVDGIILKWIFRKWDGAWTSSLRLRIGIGAGRL